MVINSGNGILTSDLKKILMRLQAIVKHGEILRASVQFSSIAQSCLTLCDPMNHSTPGLPVHHQLPEFTQTHVHRVGDAIQPSHPLSSPSPPAPNPSQHQSLFQWVNSLHEVVKVLEFQLQALSKSISQWRQEAVNPLPQSKTPIVQIKQPQFLYHPPLVFIWTCLSVYCASQMWQL